MKYLKLPFLKRRIVALLAVCGLFVQMAPVPALALNNNLSVSLGLENSQGYSGGEGTILRPNEQVTITAEFFDNGGVGATNPVYSVSLPAGLTMVGGTLESYHMGSGYSWGADTICGSETDLIDGTTCTQGSLEAWGAVGFRFQATTATSGYANNPMQVVANFEAQDETSRTISKNARVASTVASVSPNTGYNTDATALTISGSGFQGAIKVYLITDSNDIVSAANGETSTGSPVFDAVGSTFQTDGVEAGDFLEITAGADADIYKIRNVVDEDTLQIDDDFPGGRIFGANNVGVAYEIHKAYELTGSLSVNGSGTQITGVTVPPALPSGNYRIMVEHSGGTLKSVYTAPTNSTVYSVQVDTAAPVITITSTTPNEIEDAQTSDITWSADEDCAYNIRVGGDGTDPAAGIAITGANATGNFTLAGGNIISTVNFADLPTEGNNQVWIYCTDPSNNVGSASTLINRDTTAPFTAASPLGGTYLDDVTVNLTTYLDDTKTTEDTNATIYYTIDGTDPSVTGCPGACAPQGTTQTYSGPITINANTTLKFIAIDTLGHTEEYIKQEEYLFDIVPPVFASAEAINDTTIQLTFDENIGSVGSASDFTATGLSVQSVSINSEDFTKVDLTVSPLNDTAYTAADLNLAAQAICDEAANCIAAVGPNNIDDKQSPSFVSAIFDDNGTAGDTTDDLLKVTYSEDLSAALGDHDATAFSSTSGVFTIDTACGTGGVSAVNASEIVLCLSDRTADSATDLNISAGAVRDANANLSIEELNLEINDAVAPTLTLINPAVDSVDNETIEAQYTLSEQAEGGSVKLTFTHTSGAVDANSPHVVTALLTTASGNNTININGTDLNADEGATTTDTLVSGATYTVCLDANDLAGNAGTPSCRTGWTFDNSPTDAPVINLAFSSPTTNATPTIDWIDVNQDEEFYHFQTSVLEGFGTVFIDDETLTKDQNNYTYAGLSDGRYYVRVRTKDDAENYSNWSNVETFEVDATPPTDATITAPQDGKAVSGNFTVTGTASDASASGLEKVEVCIYDTTASMYWDGAAWQAGADCGADWVDANDTSGGGFTAWDYNFTGAITSGNAYTIQAKATDKAGNIFNGPVVNITGDTTNPNGTITSQNDADYVTEGNVTVAGTATDNVAVSAVQVRITRNSDGQYWDATSNNFVAGETWNNASDTSGAGTFATWETDFDTSASFDGVTYTITTKIIDSAIDTANETTLADITVTKDGTAPDTAITMPTATGYTAAEWTAGSPMAGTATDAAAGVSKVQVRIADSSGNYWDGGAWIATETWLDATGTNNWTYAWTPDKDDEFTLSVRGTDNSKRGNGTGGNIETTPATATFTYDTDAPSITDAQITAVQEGGNSTITVTFDEDMDATSITNAGNWSVTDTDTLGGATDAVSVDSVTYDNLVYTATLTVSGMTWQTGETYTIDASGVTDAAGNAVSPATINELQEDYTPPTFVSAKFVSDTEIEITYNENLNTDTAQHNAGAFTSATFFPSGALSVVSVVDDKITLEIPSLSGDTAVTAADLNIAANAVRDASTAITNGNASQETINNANIDDGQAPVIINTAAAASPGDGTVVITFSEPVDSSADTNAYSAARLANYTLESPTGDTAETISAANVNNETVTLTITSALTIGETYTITIDGVADANDITNTISNLSDSGTVGGGLMISEIVTSPQTNWNGAGGIDTADEWVELYITADGLDLTSNNFKIEVVDGTDFSGTVNGAAPAFQSVQYFGTGTVNNTNAGDRIVLMTPMAGEDMTDDVQIILNYQGTLADDDGDVNYDTITGGTILDTVKLGGGATEAPSGASTAIYDEAILRNGDMLDTDNDATDFAKGTATLGTLDTTAPVLTTRFPSAGELIPSRTFTLKGSFTEAGSGILDKTNFSAFEIDGVDETAAMTYDPATQEFTWNATNIAPGMHTVRIVVSDNAGNTASTMQWNFWVDQTTIQVTRVSQLLEPIFPTGDTTDQTEDTLITVTTYGAGVSVEAIQDQLLTKGVDSIEAWNANQADRGFGWAASDASGSNYTSFDAFAAPGAPTAIANVAKLDPGSLGGVQTYTFYVRYKVNPANPNQPGGDYTNNITYDVKLTY